MNQLQYLRQQHAKATRVKATIYYTENSFPRQKQVAAPTEEKLLHTIFEIPIDAYPEKMLSIKQVHYQGELLYWSDFLAHSHFAKGRMSFDEFKKALFEKPEKITA